MEFIGLGLWAAAYIQWFGRCRSLPERADRRFRAVLLFVVGLYFVAGFWS